MFQYIKIGKISECPYCNKKLNKIPKRKSKCIFCNKYIFVRTRPLDKKKVLIKEVELNIIDREWFKYNQEKEYNQLLNDPEFLLSKKELVREFKKEPSLNDIKWRLYSKKDLEYISNRNWGLYTNNKLNKARILHTENKFDQALRLYLEVCYLDINGPNNLNVKFGEDTEIMKQLNVKDFNLNNSLLAIGVIGSLKEVIEKLNISTEKVGNLFLSLRDVVPIELPLSLKKSWNVLLKELK